MNEKINQLINFALKNEMIKKEDEYYSINKLLDLLKIDRFKRCEVDDISLYDILDSMLKYACEKELI